jgi:alpha-galactosidase
VTAGDLAVLRAAGACAVVDLAPGTAPRLLHYGADLGPDVGGEVVRAAVTPSVPNSSFEIPIHPGLLPVEAEGWLGRPGLAGHRGGRQLLPRILLDAVTTNDGSRLTISAGDEQAGVSVESELVLEPSGVLRVRHTVANTAGEPLDLTTLDASIPFPPLATEVLDLSGRWSRERAPVRGPLGLGTRLREIRRGRTGHDAPLLMAVGTAGFGFRRGEVWGVHVEWSGDQCYAAECLPEGAGAGAGLLRGGELLRPGEITLDPDETYATPWVLFVWSDEGLDGASARIHRHVRARPSHPRRPRPVVLNTWEAVYFDHDFDRLRRLAETAASIGVERFVLDDGWFRHRRDDTAGLGDWYVDDDVWPAGLQPLVDVVRRLGMEVGLWVEPEMVNLDSDVARAHPDWVLGPPGRRPIEWRHQQVLDVADPDVADYLFARLDAVVSEYRLDFLKWDHNRDLSEAVSAGDGVAASHRQTTATYALLDRLRAAHPGLEIESCSSGGARVDLGILARTDRVWASDTVDAIERQPIQRWTSLLLPLELIGSHVGPPVAHTTGRAVDLGFRCLTALFAHTGIEWDISAASERERHRLAAWTELYKELRPLLHGGEVVRADDEPSGLFVHGVVADDRAAALYAVVRLASAAEASPGPFRLPGLDESRDYRVRVRGEFFAPDRGRPPPWWNAAAADGFTVSGAVLGRAGLQLPVLMPGQGFLLHGTAEHSEA